MAESSSTGAGRLVHPRDYHQESWHSQRGAWLREAVFGVNDGLVATLGIVAGVTASRLGHLHVVLAALVSVVAAVVSMALGSYISTRSQIDFYDSQIGRERQEILDTPEHEMQEIAEIYADYGFSPEEIAIFQRRFAQNHELWLEFMLRDELGILQERMENPISNALTMAAAVLVGSMPPVLPYLLTPSTGTALKIAFVLSAAAAFSLGALKATVANGVWWKSGFQFLAVAMAAAVIGIGIGDILPHLFGA